VIKISIILLFVLPVFSLNAFEWNLSHRITASGKIDEAENQQFCIAGQYQPDLSLTFWQKDFKKFDSQQIIDLSLHFFAEEQYSGTQYNLDFFESMYRSWLRYSGEQYEIRLGLQQLNFGTATIHRSLKWFDNIDPRDSNNQTEGVYALLGKKYFLNNANLWFWLLKPDAPVLNKFFDYVSRKVEFGGRVQYPFQYCEAGFSAHHGKSDTFDSETKLGLDLRWDMAIGFWLESSLNIYKNSDDKLYSRLLVLGGDYTLGIGSGIYCLAEHLYYSNPETELMEPADRSGASSLLLSYPVSMFDSIKGIISYNWRADVEYYHLSYNRNYDYLSIYLNINFDFNNDVAPNIAETSNARSIELMLETKF
jgi:hypothetical protein